MKTKQAVAGIVLVGVVLALVALNAWSERTSANKAVWAETPTRSSAPRQVSASELPQGNLPTPVPVTPTEQPPG